MCLYIYLNEFIQYKVIFQNCLFPQKMILLIPQVHVCWLKIKDIVFDGFQLQHLNLHKINKRPLGVLV